jgi:putative restriction endonuclease
MDSKTAWLIKVGKLRVNAAHEGRAPHKPLLLLVVLDLIESQGPPADGLLELTPDLAFRFSAYASVVAHRRSQTIRVRYPFYHLKSDGVWQPLDESKQPTGERSRVRFAALDASFLECLCDAEWRSAARRRIIAVWFEPKEQAALCVLSGLPVPEDGAGVVAQDPLEAAVKTGREARFRINVVYNYRFTCALSGYRLTTIDSGSIVDAAHIHQFADSRNNDPRNGLALSKNAHWLFDNGLWTVDRDYRVLVADSHFDEQCSDPGSRSLTSYHGQPLFLPAAQSHWPGFEYVEWHRTKRFRGRVQ